MPLTIAEFWKLLANSRLVTGKHCQQLQLDFTRSTQGSSANDPHATGNWLVAEKILTPYQSTVLLNGHSGPFFYGDYRVQDRITEGRFDGYFQAIHQPTAHHVLLQFLTGDQYRNPVYWQQVVSSVHDQSAINAPTLQGVHEILDAGDFRLVAYEDLGEGQTAAELLATSGRLTAPDASRLCWSVVHALRRLDEAGNVCGSVCPENLWIASNGHFYLIRNCTQRPESLDFSQPDQNPHVQMMLDYCAPELAASDQPCSALSDMYALGCTCYELLTGKPAFPGPQPAEKIQQHATLPIPPLEPLGVPQPLARLVGYLMAKNPQLRYQTWDDLLQKLATQVNPEHQNIPTIEPAATEARYQAFVQQRQATVAAKAAAQTINPTARRQIETERFPSIQTADSASQGNKVAAGKSAETTGLATTSSDLSSPEPSERKWWQSSAIIWVASALGVLVLTAVIFLNLPRGEAVSEVSKKDKPGKRNTPSTKTTTDNSRKSGTNSTEKTGSRKSNNEKPPKQIKTGPPQTIVEDPQGELLWASPTQGPPVKLKWVPPSGQMFMLIRPANLLASQEGQRVLTALGPTFEKNRSQWEQDSAVKLADIDSMVLTLHDNDEAFPRPSFVVQLKKPQSQKQLLAAWGNPQATKSEGDTYFKGSKWSFYLPSDGEGRTFVMGVEEDVREVAAKPNATALLRRELAELLKTTDTDRHFTVLFAPNFLTSNLFRDGRQLFFGDPGKLRKPLEWLIGEEVKAGLLSLHMNQHFYLEARLFGGLGRDQVGMARNLRDRMQEIPDQIEEYFAILNPPPYWRLVANRYPLMVRQLHRQTRIGIDRDHAMINIAMQPEAAHNLFLGGELCLSSTPGAGPVVTAVDDNGPKTIDELLQHKFTVEILQQDLEFAIKDIVSDVRESVSSLPFEFDIKIIGTELKLEGITRNQAVRNFAVKDKPLADILTGVVSKANPDPSVKDPSEPNQKLLWVIAEDPDKAGSRIILITTRKDAEEEKYLLPKPFQPK